MKGKTCRKVMATVLIAGMLLMQGEAPMGIGQVEAAEEGVTVKSAQAVLYSTDQAVVYSYPDWTSTKITTIQEDVPVEVLGVTSNGWFQVNINGKYYIPGTGLKSPTIVNGEVVTYDENGIKRLTSGTFSFYEHTQLVAFTKSDIDEMNENEYIKYLDSFLVGNAEEEYCIIKETGLTLKDHYAGLAQADAEVAKLTEKEYLVSYRNQFLTNSFYGPFRTQQALELALTRAIRYQRKNFETVYKNAGIGSKEESMEELLKDVVAKMKSEQGVTFTYKKKYDTYKVKEGTTSKGWIINFTLTE